jgi:hypothetical protein
MLLIIVLLIFDSFACDIPQSITFEPEFSSLITHFQKTSVQCSSLKQAIPHSQLKELYKEWVNDPFYRMKIAAESCLDRAYLLAAKLAELGYKSKMIGISSPVILGLNIKKTGTAETYYSYGEHYVLSIDSGNEELILDPQFMDFPIERNAYFKLVTAQDCIQNPGIMQNGGHEAVKPGKCLWEYLPSNISPSNFDTQKDNECTWPEVTKVREKLLKYNQNPPQFFHPSLVPIELRHGEKLSDSLLVYRYDVKIKDLKSDLQLLKDELIQIQDHNDEGTLLRSKHLRILILQKESTIGDLEIVKMSLIH